MYKPYMMPVIKAFPDVKIGEPRISRFVRFGLRVLVRLYLFMFYGIAKVFLRGEKELFSAFNRALNGESRCIIAFRHPNGGEPQLLAWFIFFKLKRLAAKAGVKFSKIPHTIFIYGYEVARWGGPMARYVMPNVGALPIHHSKLDKRGMERIYSAIVDGCYPVSLAPEGQVSYTTESVPRLEKGVIRIGFTAAERLAKKSEVPDSKNIPLEILPLAIHSRFGPWGVFTLERLIRKIEKYTGKNGRNLPFSQRLKLCRDCILEENEKRYNIRADLDTSFEQRLGVVINAALTTTEKILGVETQGDLFARMYALRQVCWDRIMLPDVDSFKGFTKMARSIKDLAAGEAWHAGRHLELVDLGWYIREEIPADDAPLHHKVEYAQNIWDLINRTMGGAYHSRTSILPRRVTIQAAPILNLTERLGDYKKDKKAAVAAALDDLKNLYLKCIDDVNKAE